MRLRRILPPLLVLAVGGVLVALQARDGAPAPKGPEGDGAPAGDATKGPAPAPEKPAGVEPVRVQTVPRTEGFPAVVRSPEPVAIHCPLAHTPVGEVLVRAGQGVEAGQVLVRMSGAAWEKALARAKEAKDAPAIERAEEALRSLEVRSPVDGVVFQVNASRGEIPVVPLSGPRRPLVLLFDWRKMEFAGTAPPEVARLIEEGAPVFVRLGREEPVPAAGLRRGDPGSDGSLPVTVLLGAPPTSAPASGEAAEIRVVAGTKEVAVVPLRAIRWEGGRPVVFVSGVTGELRPKPVVLGDPLPDDRIEVSGLDRFDGVAVWGSGPGGK
jgi:multidrug efflux pump subunit AcrA (membrane-fusion protein)